MRVKLLGTAAGGAFPQWNCACQNCRSLREGRFAGKARTQLQVAVSTDSRRWFLLNASPDIRTQIENDPVFHPIGAVRVTPIAGVVLTSGDLDQVLGLLMLREFQKFRIFASPSLQRILREDNSMFSVLNRVPGQVTWVEISPGSPFPLVSADERENLCCTPVSLGQHLPPYVSETSRQELRGDETLLGLMIQSPSGRKLAYFPAVPAIGPALMRDLQSADVVLFDGTFWLDDELHRIRGTGPTAREIGHVPVSGQDGSLELLSALTARRIYIHINNTNPMLDESSAEYRQVRDAGWEIGEDGWEFEL
jgi:pyrroloquinoline quinone biosynthesis protein B